MENFKEYVRNQRLVASMLIVCIGFAMLTDDISYDVKTNVIFAIGVYNLILLWAELTKK